MTVFESLMLMISFTTLIMAVLAFNHKK
ncbi:MULTISPECIES: putative holin-like toxin [Cytobacillus]|nr:putative holin-like toxin [Cytobacillus kochii]